jgi:hypothetical protein
VDQEKKVQTLLRKNTSEGARAHMQAQIMPNPYLIAFNEFTH